MVLRELGDDAVLCFGQPAHAWVAGQLAGAWGNGLFAEPRPRDEVVLAAMQHDLGMAAWDASPELNPETGWPMSFLEMPVETHLRLWTAAPRLALSQSRWVALLVALHGAHLYSGRAGQPGVDDFLADMRAFAAAMRTSLGVSEEDAARQQRHARGVGLDVARPVPRRAARRGGVERPLRLESAGEGTVTVPRGRSGARRSRCPRTPGGWTGASTTRAAMREALRVAPWQRVAWRLVPA